MTWPVHPAADMFPLLDDADLRDLAADIKANGLNNPVWLIEDDRGVMLLDGRNRVAACKMAGIEPLARTYTGDDPIGFALSENLKRRHLNAGQRAVLALKVEPAYAAEAARRKSDAGAEYGRGRPSKVVADLPQPVAPQPKARDRAAKAVGASGRVVQQAKRVATEAPDLLSKVESGELAIDRADRIIRDRQAEAKRIESARVARETTPERPCVDVRSGDFREVLADLSDVDAIITDPPYPAEFLPLLADMAAWADKVLAPNGVLVVLIGQTHLPEVYRLLDGHRPYRWTGCYLTPGAGYVSHPRRVQSNWKPVLVYGGGPRFADTVRSMGTDAGAKDLHHWGQDYGAFHTLVERLTTPGQTVVDPFMGAGTTLLAANALGRHAIGCDIDPEHVETTRRRLT